MASRPERGRAIPDQEWRDLLAQIAAFLRSQPALSGVECCDLVQATLLRVVDRFARDLPGSADERAAYALRVARSVRIDHQRRLLRERLRLVGGAVDLEALLGPLGPQGAWAGNPAAAAEARETSASVRAFLLRHLDFLSVRWFLLTRLEGETMARACTRLGLTPQQGEAIRKKIARFLGFLSGSDLARRFLLQLGLSDMASDMASDMG